MSIDFFDTESGWEVTTAGFWAPGIPRGKFWFAVPAALPLSPGLVAQFQVGAADLPRTHGAAMLWLTTDGCPRHHLAVELFADEVALYRSLASMVPQGLVAVRGADVTGPEDKPLSVEVALVARVQYCGPLRQGARATVRPTVLLTRCES